MHRITKEFFRLLEDKNTITEFCKEYGYSFSTLKSWKRSIHIDPSIGIMDKVLNSLGYELSVKKIKSLKIEKPKIKKKEEKIELKGFEGLPKDAFKY